jgi:hypothetical protein
MMHCFERCLGGPAKGITDDIKSRMGATGR